MLVVTLTDCPLGLRGDLTKWLLEIQSGVFVGNISARVREKLWGRIQQMCKSGRAVMVYRTNGEQRLDFKVLGNTWEPIDFDGIKLMLRPSPSRLKKPSALKPGFSKAATRLMAKRASAKQRFPTSYMVVDLETTGLDTGMDEIIEIGATKVEEGEISGRFSLLVRPENPLSQKITEITGITEQMISEQGVDLLSAFSQFLDFVGASPIVSHNADFDYGFLRSASAKCGLQLFANRCIDTLALSKRAVRGVKNYKLSTLAEHFGIASASPHRSENDCCTTQLLYEKLINLLEPN
jgi:CRISPR-associated protein Cas2